MSNHIANHIRAARELVGQEGNGMLCTLSQKLAGFPFGSIAPFTLTAAGEPLILISEIAEHTRNARADARVSLLVTDSQASADPQAGARATLIGYAFPVSQPFLDDARRRYLERFPLSASYFDAHDFTLFKIKTVQVRFIGGFGDIHWIDGKEMIDPAADAALDAIAPHAEGICRHMNEDHAEAMVAYARAFAATAADAVQMIAVDSRGFDLIAVAGGAHRHIRLGFAEPATTTEAVRKAMVEMVRRARQIPG